MNTLRLYILMGLLWCGFAGAAAPAGGDTIVSYVVCDAGSDIYELEGHAALRVQMPGSDVAVNYGLFDFSSPGFVWRFALGETDYMCGAAPWAYFAESYRRAGRRVTEHRLDLTAAEKRRLIDFLADNLRPENAVYRYNYVKDNCATRPLRAVEAAIADSIMLPDPDGRIETFRSMMRHYHRNYPWYQFGIDLALGSGIDYELTPREKSFAPVMLDAQLREARTASGRKLVAATAVAVDYAAGAAVQGPTPWWATPMTAAVAVLLLAAGFTARDLRRRRTCRAFDTALFGLFSLLGCLIFFLSVFSSHEATSPNYLLAWLNPLCLIPVIFIWIKKARNLVLCYQIANFAMILLFSAFWPLLPQCANAAIWPLVAADALRAASYILINRPHRK